MAATVSFRLNKPKNKDGSLKSQAVGILICYYRNGLEVELSTKQKVPPANFTGTRVADIPRAKQINKALSDLENSLLNVPFNFPKATKQEEEQIVRSIIKGETEATDQKKTVAHIVTQFIAQYEREKDPATVKRYRGLLKKLTAFNPDLTIDQLDQNFYDGFKNFLYRCHNPNYTGYHLHHDVIIGAYVVAPGVDLSKPIGLFDDVVFKYLVNLKTVCAWAEKRNHQVHQSYKTWEIIKRDYQPISLTLDELRAIENLHLPEKHLDIARDYLSLECRTGQRISDLRRFTKGDLDGNRWIFTQKKGNRLNANKITLPLIGYCAPALLILQKYNYELPRISEQRLNEHIKTVCVRAGIVQSIFIERYAGAKRIRIPGFKYEFISTHTGRKTFITIALQSMMPHTVMQITGIRSFKTLKHYAGEAELSTIEAGLRSIEDNIAIMKKHG